MSQQRGTRSTPLVALSMGLLALAFVALVGCEKMREQREREMGFPKATYADMWFCENSNQAGFVKFDTSKTAGLAKIYVEFPDGSRHYLPGLTEETVGKVLEKQGSITQNNPRTRYSDGLSRIIFREGKLQSVSLEASLATWKIAAKEEGPYLALPISKADLVKHFGEPDSWDVYVPPPVP